MTRSRPILNTTTNNSVFITTPQRLHFLNCDQIKAHTKQQTTVCSSPHHNACTSKTVTRSRPILNKKQQCVHHHTTTLALSMLARSWPRLNTTTDNKHCFFITAQPTSYTVTRSWPTLNTTDNSLFITTPQCLHLQHWPDHDPHPASQQTTVCFFITTQPIMPELARSWPPLNVTTNKSVSSRPHHNSLFLSSPHNPQCLHFLRCD